MQACAVIDEKRFRTLMETWVEWHRRDDPVAEGFADHCAVVSSNASKHWEDLEDAADAYVAEMIEAEVNDLPMNELVAVHHVWLLSVWRIREPIEVAYARAKDRLVDRLEARGLE